MVSLAISGLVTGASKKYSEIEDKEREAKRAIDLMAVKRMAEMQDFKEQTDYKSRLELEQKAAIMESLGLGGLGGATTGSTSSTEPHKEVAAAYAMQGQYGKAKEVLAQPHLYTAKDVKQQEDINEIQFAREYGIKFADGKTLGDVVDAYDTALEKGGTSPLKDQSPASRVRTRNMYESLTKDLIAPYVDQGRVGKVTSSTLSNTALETTRAINSVKQFMGLNDEATTKERLKDLDSLIPELQNIYDPSGGKNFNIFRNRNMFNINELRSINEIIKSSPKEFPNLLQEVKEIQNNKEALQRRGQTFTPQEDTTTPQSTRSFVVRKGSSLTKVEDTPDPYSNLR